MSQGGRHPRLEGRLARLLDVGTWLAVFVILSGFALGLSLPLIGGGGALPAAGMRIVTAGIAIFLLLPVLRVFVMLIVFAGEGDYRLSAIAALVLAIIGLGAMLGFHSGALPG